MNDPQLVAVPERPERRSGNGFGVRLRPGALNGRMQALGLTGAALARKANVAEATVSQARNGRPIHPMKFRAIAKALAEFDPIPGVDGLIDRNDGDGEARR